MHFACIASFQLVELARHSRKERTFASSWCYIFQCWVHWLTGALTSSGSLGPLVSTALRAGLWKHWLDCGPLSCVCLSACFTYFKAWVRCINVRSLVNKHFVIMIVVHITCNSFLKSPFSHVKNSCFSFLVTLFHSCTLNLCLYVK